jgi:two-component system, sensor histidine kinase SagS
MEQVKRLKVLVLRGQGERGGEVVESVRPYFEVVGADTIEEAVKLLKEGEFDAVFSLIGDFLPLERAAVSQQAVGILNTIGEGVCITDADGMVLWANQKLEGFDAGVRKCISERSRLAYTYFASQKGMTGQPRDGMAGIRPRKYSFSPESSNRHFEMITTPMLDGHGALAQVATVVWEATSSRMMQERINAIDKAGSELVRLEAESIANMTVEQRISVVQDKIIRYARQLLHFDNFVVRILNRKTNQLEILFGVGLPEEEAIEIFAEIEGNGITGYVAATGRSYICMNTATDPRYMPGLTNARSSLTVPLRLHDKVIGTLNVESAKEEAFGEDDRQMAEIFGRYIAIALNILDLLVVERYQTTGQAADSLSRQVSEPLGQILTEASMLIEEYIGHDDLRTRLQAIVDNVGKIKASIRDVQAGPKGILGIRSAEPVAADPLLAGRAILVVDDEQFIRQTIADVFGKYNSLVDTVRDGREAIALLAVKRYDLIISDIKLPHATGYEVFAMARQTQPSISVILMTGFGYDPNHSIVRANKEGLNAVLYKPFRVNQLLDEVRKALTSSNQK